MLYPLFWLSGYENLFLCKPLTVCSNSRYTSSIQFMCMHCNSTYIYVRKWHTIISDVFNIRRWAAQPRKMKPALISSICANWISIPICHLFDCLALFAHLDQHHRSQKFLKHWLALAWTSPVWISLTVHTNTMRKQLPMFVQLLRTIRQNWVWNIHWPLLWVNIIFKFCYFARHIQFLTKINSFLQTQRVQKSELDC